MRYINFDTFERVSAGLLMLGMAVVILLTIFHFALGLYEFTVGYSVSLDYGAFQRIFDRVLAAVIALELARSVHQMAQGKHGVVQVRTVILIGVLAVVRKLILLEIESTSGVYLIGLSATILSLGAVYGLLCWVEIRVKPEPSALEDATEKEGAQL
ncbi:MAG: hypothetical protein GVY06_10840 [Alphaproteobacteria bacterium]|jgi:uncharacterized membrane protein (DUF373 family)|nr:hypothetical protein [Alphaproteobacteria bacterium]